MLLSDERHILHWKNSLTIIRHQHQISQKIRSIVYVTVRSKLSFYPFSCYKLHILCSLFSHFPSRHRHLMKFVEYYVGYYVETATISSKHSTKEKKKKHIQHTKTYETLYKQTSAIQHIIHIDVVVVVVFIFSFHWWNLILNW